MSRKWQIGIGILAVVVGVLGLMGMASNALWSFHGPPGHWERVHKIHHYRGDMPDLSKLEVKLIDEDGDGIPDRGEVKMPQGENFKQGQRGERFGMHQEFREFGSRHYEHSFGPGAVIFGLIRCFSCLGFLALLFGAGIFFFRRRRKV